MICFESMSDIDLTAWLGQYSGRQAGYYPGLRRSRSRAEREARKRGLAWWRGATHYRPTHIHMSRLAYDVRRVFGY
jgi:hypothetical protein